MKLEVINEKTKLAQSMNAKYEKIEDAYKRPSFEKIRAFYLITKEMESLNGYNMRVTGAGCDIFSCAYKIKEGNNTYIVYNTPSHKYKIKLTI